jgi:hypothetical protein
MRFKVSRETSLHPMETLKNLQSSQLERSVSEVKDEHSEQQRRRRQERRRRSRTSFTLQAHIGASWEQVPAKPPRETLMIAEDEFGKPNVVRAEKKCQASTIANYRKKVRH